MGKIYKILDAAVFVICLPFYIVIYPVVILAIRLRLNRLRKLSCGACGFLFSGIGSEEILSRGGNRIFREGHGKIDWENIPEREIKCPNCSAINYFNKRDRLISCVSKSDGKL